MIRPEGVSPTAESWHRDIAPNTPEGDEVFGGWLNLDSQPQEFSVILQTHRDTVGATGFATIKGSSKEEQARINAELSARSTKIKVPPGCLLIFNERLIHEVCKGKKNFTSVRLFMGWRLTHSTVPLIPQLEQRLMTQAVMPLKSGQMPGLFAKLHWTNWRGKIDDIAKAMVHTEESVVQSGKCKGDTHRVPHQPNSHMPSLDELSRMYPGKVKKYTEYSIQEMQILTPQPLAHM